MATVYKDYSSYIVNFKGFFVKNANIYSLFQSDSPFTLVTRKPKLHLHNTVYECMENGILTNKKFSEYVWNVNTQPYETSLPQVITETKTEESPVTDKIRYEQLNKPVYVDIENKKNYPQYFIPQNDGSYELCTLNGGEAYNKKVITPDRTVKKAEDVGFIVINYLHNNKQDNKRIPVKVEVRECNINCTENYKP